MTLMLCAVFFASGAAALMFEALWFRQAGLVLGNSIWASAIVTAAFMAGLAVGNGVVAKRGPRTTRPLFVYAALELAVGVVGALVVWLLPGLVSVLGPLFRSFESTFGVNALRLGAALLVLVVPSSAMGATLPLLARALSAADENFGRILGRLYGWNTLGAVSGVLAAEVLVVPALGVRGAALVAGALDLFAAATALWLARRPWVR